MAENNMSTGNKDDREKGPLLSDKLSASERAMLAQVTHHGGYKVIIKLMEALCDRISKDEIRLDPEKPGYEDKLAVRHQRARNANEVCAELLKSIEWHIRAAANQELTEEADAVDIVAKTFGIHPVPPKATKNKK